MKRQLAISILILFAAFIDNTYAPNDIESVIDEEIKRIRAQQLSLDTSKRFKVYVEIYCGDDITKNLIESHIKRELRSLQDVEIVAEENAELYLPCMAIMHTTKSGQKTGYISIAYNILSKYPTRVLASVLNKEDYRLLSDPNSIWKLPPLFFAPYIGLVNGATTNIDELCKGIVVKFDVNLLEPQREYKQKMKIK